MGGLGTVIAVLALAAIAVGGAAVTVKSAELQGVAEICDGKICPWHRAKFPVPKGWKIDEAWTKRYKAVFLFRNGDKSAAGAVMYVRAHAGDPKQELADYIKVAQSRWQAQLPTSTIEPLPDLDRPGKPGLAVFLYRNPSRPEQAFELTAFLKDTDAAHPDQTYFFQIVLAAPTRNVLEAAKAAFYDVLKGI